MQNSGKSAAWTRHYDETYKSFYWHNEQTGESRWEEDSSSDAKGNEEVVRQGMASGQPNLQKKKQTILSGFSKFLRSSSTLRSSTDEGRNLIDPNNIDEATADEKFFLKFGLCNAVFLEAPLCVLEGVLRVIISVLALLIIFGFSFLCISNALTAIATITLLIPGVILRVYRDASPNRPWDLLPVPTLIGLVDPRRFAVVTIFGLGRVASNSYVYNDTIAGKARKEQSATTLDVWDDSLCCAPKDVLRFMQRSVLTPDR